MSPSGGKNDKAFASTRRYLGEIIDGSLDYDPQARRWFYKNKRNQKFAIATVSEGAKKVAMLERLLANGFLSRGSCIFMDGIESGLHPSALCEYLDMIDVMAKEREIQVFMATHSYFALKKLFLIAMKAQNRVTCISLHKSDAPKVYDLHDGMPDNSIIDMSIRLHEQELEEML